jgi:hypothetical protein
MSQTDQANYGLIFGYSVDDLLTVEPNIRLAVAVAAKLVAQDKVIAAGCGNSSARGMARYWSTMRTNDCGNPSFHALAEIISQSQKAPGCAP